MPREVCSRCAYAREHVTFFVEEMIVYVLRHKGIGLEIIRPEHLEQLRTVAMFSFSPSIGDAVITTSNLDQNRVLADSSHIWGYIRTLRRNLRKEVLHSSLVVYGMELIRDSDEPRNLFILMAVVTDLCERFCRFGHASLVGSAVSSLDFIFHHLVRGGFARTVIKLTNQALHLRILTT